MFDLRSFYLLVLKQAEKHNTPMSSRGFLSVEVASPGTWAGEGAALGQSISSNTVIAVFQLVGSKSQGVMADCYFDIHEKPCHWPK